MEDLGHSQAEVGAKDVNVDRLANIDSLKANKLTRSPKKLDLEVKTHAKQVKADVLVDVLEDDFYCGHDDELSETRFAEHSAQRYQH